MRKRLTLTLMTALVLLAAVTGIAAAEQATVVRAGNLVLRLNGGVAPKRLPKRRMAPIALHASASLATTDGSQPPVAKTVRIDFDRNGTINARGLAVCPPGQLQSRDTRAAEAACPKAIVGKGKTTVRVAFPEQGAFTTTGPLVLFNGGVRGGVTMLYVHAYVDVPTPTAIVTPVKITKLRAGRYGTRAIATIPRIAGGSGAVTRFAFTIHRSFRRDGRNQSYLLARCASGRFFAHAIIGFSDGTRVAGTVVRACQAKG